MATISLGLWFDGNFTLMGRPFQALNGGPPDPGRAARATEAMLQMRKPDLAAMREAADQASA